MFIFAVMMDILAWQSMVTDSLLKSASGRRLRYLVSLIFQSLLAHVCKRKEIYHFLLRPHISACQSFLLCQGASVMLVSTPVYMYITNRNHRQAHFSLSQNSEGQMSTLKCGDMADVTQL